MINMTEEMNHPVPETEPARQFYFMGLASEILKKKTEEAGRPLTFCVETFGCQMNARDSEKLRGILERIGFIKTESEDADLVIYNTCTVRENANTKVYGRLGYLNSLKKKNHHMMIALCGCMMQEPEVVERLKKSYRFVNLVFGTHNIFKLAELLVRAMTEDEMVVEIWDRTDQIVEDLPVDRKYPFKSGVNIMYGCNNFCTYCIVPYVRGREKSREPEDILCEVDRLVKDGVREVMLLGQNVNSYGKGLENQISFAELLRRIASKDGLDRVRFMTSHPKDLSDELIHVIAENPKICRHFHLPLQSGSDRLLKKMNRHYTKSDYLSLVEKIRSAVPDISLTTDIIVGFPGETEEDFLETMDVVEKVRYDSAFTFIYSRRTGTPAAKMEDQIDEAVIKNRFDRLLKRIQEIGREETARFTGQCREVLVENVNEHDPSLVTGRLDNNFVVHFKGDSSLIGRIVPVSLDECKGFYYIGRQNGDAY